jgi:isopentenyldiphosphate isomerase
MTEFIDVVDEKDNIVGKASREDIRGTKVRHRATGIIVFNNQGEFIVHKRPLGRKLYPGEYDIFFGGAVDCGEDYDIAAHRELGEEAGIKYDNIIPLFNFKYTSDVLCYNGHFYYCVHKGGCSFQKTEVENARFITLDEFEQMLETEKFCDDLIELWKKHKNKIIKISKEIKDSK